MVSLRGFLIIPKIWRWDISYRAKNEPYSYLGMSQSKGTDNKRMPEQLKDIIKSRLKKIMKFQIQTKRSKPTYTLTAPVISYNIGLIKWTVTELDALNLIIRMTFIIYRAHHPKVCMELTHTLKDAKDLTLMTLDMLL